jgi:ABC-type transport system substrate-binding protein
MRSIRRKTEPSFVWTAAILFVAGCGGELASPIAAANEADETPRKGGTLHLASFADVRSLDPAVSSDGLSVAAIRLIYAGLVEFDLEGNVAPDLASRFEVDAAGTTYRFFLREGVRMHDGDELTADDVKRSIERALHPTTPNPVSSFYESIVGFGDYSEKKSEHLDGVAIEGRYVVAIHLREPDATFLRVLALTPLRIVCKSAGARYVDGWPSCGAGPFKLLPGGWEQGRSLTLVRHEGYFRPGFPHLDAVSWQLSLNFITERLKFERGEVDVTRDLTQPDALRFQNDPRWRPFGAYEADRIINGEAMNTEMPPFDNVEIRRAVAAGIDREHLVLVKPSNLHAAGQPIPPSIPGFDPSVRGQSYDYAAALEHMRKAGYPFDPKTGKGGWPQKIPYVVYKQGLYEFTGQVLAQDLAKIGLSLEIKMVSYPTFLSISRRRGKALLSPQAWTEDFPDPSDFFDPLFASKMINDEDSNNAAFYKNPELDALLDRGRRELEPAARREIYARATRIVCDDAPWAFTSTYRFYDVHQPYVRGFHLHPVWQDDVSGIWLDRASARMAQGRGIFSGALGSVLGGARGR